MKLKYQLFVVLLLASALLIALMLAVNSVSFQRQFINYVNSVEQKRLEPFIEELSGIYSETGDWNWVSQATWGELLRKHAVERRVGQLGGNKHPMPPPPPHKQKSNGRRPPANKGKKPIPWLTLVDENHDLVIGLRKNHRRMQWLPVEYAGGTAGYIGLIRHRQLNRMVDKEFARQQRRNFIYAALAMTLLSALIAVPLASRLIRPLKSVNTAIGALSNGDYSYRSSAQSNDEFGDLARNINRLGETLEQNKAARQRWIAEISHELRTPVAVLQSEIEAIQDGLRKADTQTIQSLHAEILRLGRLIDDLHQLSVSDIGALDYRMSRINLSQLLENFFSTHRHSLHAAVLQLHTSLDQNASLPGDAERINQLLENLLQNTLRYTHAPGTLEVSTEIQTDKVLLHWSDSAPGVDDEDLPLLFEPLYRADQSRNRQTSGSGLGLAIVQKIAQAHDATISASHADSGGLSLTFTFPLMPQE